MHRSSLDLVCIGVYIACLYMHSWSKVQVYWILATTVVDISIANQFLFCGEETVVFCPHCRYLVAQQQKPS